MNLSPGDIVLVPFPFTDLSHSKLRPALIISQNEVHEKEDDFTLLFVSSVIPERAEPYEVLFRKTHPDFSQSGLRKDSLFKTNKIATVRRKLLVSRLGKIGTTLQKEIKEAFHRAVFI